MSEICSEPKTFAQLEVQTDCLTSETESILQEFENKFEYISESQSTISDNETKLFHISEAIKILNLNMTAMEHELQCLQYDMELWEKLISKIDLLQGVHVCNCRHVLKSEREMFLQMLQETDARIKQMETTISDMDEIKKCCANRPYPYDMVFRILNCHQKTLTNTEKQLDLILDKLLLIASNYALKDIFS